MYKNEKFSFKLMISVNGYTEKPTSKDYNKISFEEKEITISELEQFIKQGYIFSCTYIDKEIKSLFGYKKKERALHTNIIVFDIDNTLVPHGAPADERAKRLFQRLREIGFESCLLSNNQKKRVEMFNQEIQTHYIYNALKPARKNYLHAMEIMGTDQTNTLFVGDQLFTDVWGAKRVGIHNILVHPINPKEEIQIVLKRYLEKIVLHFYKKSKKRLKKVAN